jgi:hypothetical protein
MLSRGPLPVALCPVGTCISQSDDGKAEEESDDEKAEEEGTAREGLMEEADSGEGEVEAEVVLGPGMAASDTGRIDSSFCKKIPEQMEEPGSEEKCKDEA